MEIRVLTLVGIGDPGVDNHQSGRAAHDPRSNAAAHAPLRVDDVRRKPRQLLRARVGDQSAHDAAVDCISALRVIEILPIRRLSPIMVQSTALTHGM